MTCPHCNAPLAPDARFCGACGRATVGTAPSQHAGFSAAGLQAPPDLVGREIGGRYRVVAKLGEGGMGAVYRGEQISLKRKVAIKVLKPELSADPGLVRRFNAEAELAAKLSHPNTVNIFDFGQDSDGSLFIAMELLEGVSLRQAIQDGAMPPARAIAITQQVCRSLADAHRHGIGHRDLKPDNVMLTERGRERDVARVLDVGIAKLRDDNRATVAHMTRAGDLVGTPQYMAPEQIRAEPVDGRTDVYALGAMLYEMLTARLPFEGTTVMAILSKHLTEQPAPPSQRRPDLHLPAVLDGLVLAAMAKDPAHRPQSMEAFGEHLDAIAAQLAGTPWSGAQGWSGPQLVAATPPPGSGPHHGPVGAMPSPAPGGHPPYPGGYPSTGGAMPMPMSMPAPMPMSAPTPGPRPFEAHAPMAPTPPPGYGPPMATMETRRRSSSLTPVLALVGVLAAGGAAAGIYVATRSKSADTTAPGPGTDDGSDPWGNHTGPGPGTDLGSGDPWATRTGDWTPFEGPDGRWSVALPPGLPAAPTMSNPSAGVYSFSAFVGGARVEAGALASTEAIDLSLITIDQLGAALATQLNATILESGTAMTGDTSRPRLVLEGPAFGKGEGRFYTTTDDFIVFAYYATTGDWDATAATRRQFFERVVVE